ncbi:TylF/MycF/NovP-related O-methyltransferase [Archangium violaceum]|uniref:Class I SAM-dependent methyltransferase n=1 Tax=Archangium violaceum Cb vi76 TaxID=1406225 RepID=A0A084T006_9BACT|nr:TylF/MycF/NovP-related O-methyltransferase [Archangium violaceum]KFA94041.1 hypothetical protein Q664_05215 [Archangium violaceum Cb vi76]
MRPDLFPFDLFDLGPLRRHGGATGRALAELGPLCLSPPYPWGHWLYARLIREHCRRLEGDFIECGVAKGGTSLFLARFARGLGRRVWALDSFVGLPAPDPARDNPYFMRGDYAPRQERGDLLQRFRGAIRQAGADGIVRPIQGFFETSLQRLPRRARFCFIHVDVDLYDSAWQVLEGLHDRLVEGGLLVLDDFFHHAQGPARAAGEFFASRSVTPVYHVSFPYSVVVIKGERPAPGRHRSLDGNHYSFDWLREDTLLRRALQASRARARRARATRQLDNASRLLEVLRAGRADQSSDVYEYWRALEDYWDDMDVNPSGARSEYRI